MFIKMSRTDSFCSFFLHKLFP